MNSKSLLIAIAALALTATSAQAFNGNVLIRARLSDEQRAAFAVARELQEEGDTEAAKEILIEAGIDEDVLERLREAMKDHHLAHQAILDALNEDDYEAFLTAIEDTPLADIVTSEADYDRFKEAYDLKQEGEIEEAKEILSDLGVSAAESSLARSGRARGWSHRFDNLSDEEYEAFLVAKQSNNQEAMQAVLVDAGIIDDDDEHFPHHRWSRN